MIEASGLTRRFGGRTAVDGVDLRVAPGEVVGLLGANGAGKTTTIRLLLGLLRPHAGRAEIRGRAGYLPERFAGYDALAVATNLRYWARTRGVERSSTATEVDRVLRAAGVADLATRPFGHLSKGQRQRVGFAQALLGAPPALVLDEPTNGLDPRQVVEARALVRQQARRGAAVLVSTHVLAEAAALCDRVVVVDRGAVLADEPPGDATTLERRFLELLEGRDP